MTITWYVDDGFANTKGRPHTLKIDDNDLAEYITIEEKEEYINQCVQEAFENNISWYISDYDLE